MSEDKTSRELQKIATKQKILEVAADLFICNGIMSVSTNEIAKQAGVSKGTIFHHFNNKEDLVLSVLSYFFEAEMTGFIQLMESEEVSIATFDILIYQSLRLAVDKPNLTAFIFNVFVEYSHISKDKEKSALYRIIEGFFRPMMDQVAIMLEQLGITDANNKSKILIGLLDGLGFQLFIDRQLLSDEELIGIKDEIMDIINFWRSK